MSGLRLAVVGDIHGSWTDGDARWFEQAGYDRVVVVGDLSGWRWSKTLEVASALGRMRCSTMVFPGNHDATHAVSLVNEAIAGFSSVNRAFAHTQGSRRDELAAAVQPHPLVGYSSHAIGGLTIICGRAHSMGGPSLSFAHTLDTAFGIRTLEQSAHRLCALVDAAPTERLVFVSHNGPTGLGAARDSIWGADFKAGGGDWGDPDLRVALEHARSRGKRVLAVLAGHMHRRLRGGGERPWLVMEQGTTMVNAAVVPRIVGRRHHHVEVCIDGEEVMVHDRWVEVG